MKKTVDFEPSPNAQSVSEEDLLPEYRFDYARAKPNRFAARQAEKGTLTVVLDSDVAQVFTTAEAVNEALRVLIQSTPKPMSTN